MKKVILSDYQKIACESQTDFNIVRGGDKSKAPVSKTDKKLGKREKASSEASGQ